MEHPCKAGIRAGIIHFCNLCTQPCILCSSGMCAPALDYIHKEERCISKERLQRGRFNLPLLGCCAVREGSAKVLSFLTRWEGQGLNSRAASGRGGRDRELGAGSVSGLVLQRCTPRTFTCPSIPIYCSIPMSLPTHLFPHL